MLIERPVFVIAIALLLECTPQYKDIHINSTHVLKSPFYITSSPTLEMIDSFVSRQPTDRRFKVYNYQEIPVLAIPVNYFFDWGKRRMEYGCSKYIIRDAHAKKRTENILCKIQVAFR